jgi:hypothetical protein
MTLPVRLNLALSAVFAVRRASRAAAALPLFVARPLLHAGG